MKRIIFSILGILIIGLTTCRKKVDDGDHYSTYYGIAAIVGYDADLRSPMLLTSSLGTLIAPQLIDVFYYYLNNGDALLANFVINEDQQYSTEYIVLSDLKCELVDKETPQATDGGGFANFDFIAVIDSIAPYDMVNNVAFFVFCHTAPVLQQYKYEMTYDPEQAVADDIPTVYFRAKEDGKDDVNKAGVFQRLCAFNLNDFVETYKNSKNELEINIRFFAGRVNGEDVYTDWKHNPLELKVKD